MEFELNRARNSGSGLSADSVGFRKLFERRDLLQDRFDYVFVAKFRIDHHVVERTAGPFLAKIMADEGSAFGIDLGDKLRSFAFGLAERLDAADLFVCGRIHKNVEGVRMLAQDIR